jgi:hypothetical protein
LIFHRTRILVIFLLLLPSVIFAFDLEGIQLIGGKAVILNAEPVETSTSPGEAATMFGVSVPMTFTDLLYFEPGLRLYSTTVVLDSDYKPVPAAIETMNRISVLNFELRPEVGAVFNLTEHLMLGVTGAPVFTFRFPIIAYDDAADSDDKTVVREYYFSAARFLGFYAGGLLSWNFAENYALRLKIGTNLPVYHIWDDEDIAFYDQLMIEPEIGIVFRF